MTEQKFILEEDAEGHLLSLSHPYDPYMMNWVEGATPWGTVCVPEWPKEYEGWGKPEGAYCLQVSIQRRKLENGFLQEKYLFTNNTAYDIYIQNDDIGIYVPFNDSYESAKECKIRRCNAHIWCGDQICYVMGIRMGGGKLNLGLVLTEGGVSGYGVERDISKGSNDRGDIILFSAPMCIKPGETKCIAWELFWFQDEREFFEILKTKKNYIEVKSNKYIFFEKEQLHIHSTGAPAEVKKITEEGIYQFDFYKDKIHTFANIIVLPKWERLLESRIHFIVEKQQCMDNASGLYGAYLIYDNEEKRQYYSHVYDHNAGRERVGMGVLISRYLRSHKEEAVEKSLDLYLDYVREELYDEKTGKVFNDYNKNDEWNRFYNYAWVALLFYEVYCLKREKKYIIDAYKVQKCFLETMDGIFYPIGLEVFDLETGLREAGFIKEAENLRELFKVYAERLYQCGTDYPSQEVNYEQSIVQPAAEVMMQAYMIFGDDKYLKSAEDNLKLLELFNGHQPDYHLYETALRHWDGFWFGKRKQWGDTFPHHWSALTGQSFARYNLITGNTIYAERAENALRSSLSLFRSDGSASCAMIYPKRVNGQKTHFLEPWANDQDWGMYYYLKWHDGLNGEFSVR